MSNILDLKIRLFGKTYQFSLNDNPKPETPPAPVIKFVKPVEEVVYRLHIGASQHLGNDYIRSIKAIREYGKEGTIIGLKEAKDIVDKIKNGEVYVTEFIDHENAQKAKNGLQAATIGLVISFNPATRAPSVKDQIVRLVEENEASECNTCTQARALLAAERLFLEKVDK